MAAVRMHTGLSERVTKTANAGSNTRAMYMWPQRMAFGAAFFYALLSPPIGRAQAPAFEGRPIADIQFPNGQPLDPADLARVLPLKKGQPLKAADVAQAIDGLFSTGRFTDIAVEGEASGVGVVVRIVTQNAEFLGGVAIDSKVIQNPNRAQLEGQTRLSLGTQFQPTMSPRPRTVSTACSRQTASMRRRLLPPCSKERTPSKYFFPSRSGKGKRAKYDTPTITGVTKALRRNHPPRHRLALSRSSIGGSKSPVPEQARGCMGIQNKYAGKDRLMARVDLKKLNTMPHRTAACIRTSILTPGPVLR